MAGQFQLKGGLFDIRMQSQLAPVQRPPQRRVTQMSGRPLKHVQSYFVDRPPVPEAERLTRTPHVRDFAGEVISVTPAP